MKKILLKGLAAMLSCALLLSLLPVSVFADEAKSEEPSGEEIAALVGETGDNSYENYLAANGERKVGTSSVTVDSAFLLEDQPASLSAQIPEDGYYNLGFSYRALSRETIVFSVDLDGEIPFAEAEKMTLQGIYKNEEGGNRKDGLGNEFAPKQVLDTDFYFDTLKDITKWSADDYYFYLTAGTHTFTLTPVTGSFEAERVTLEICFSKG